MQEDIRTGIESIDIEKRALHTSEFWNNSNCYFSYQ